MFTVVLTKKAHKQYDKLSNKDRERAAIAIDELEHNPFAGKKLEGDHTGLWSVRVWPYRILYSIQKEIITVTVVAIGHRQGIYKRAKR